MTPRKPNHLWTGMDEIVVLYLYKYGDKSIEGGIDAVSKALGISADSIIMKMGNYRHLDKGDSMLTNASKLSICIWEEYASLTREDHKRFVIAVLDESSNLVK